MGIKIREHVTAGSCERDRIRIEGDKYIRASSGITERSLGRQARCPCIRSWGGHLCSCKISYYL